MECSESSKNARIERLRQLAFRLLNNDIPSKSSPSENFLSALHFCSEYNLRGLFIEIIEKKDRYIPDFEITQGYNRCTLLATACEYGAIDVVEYLVKEKKVNVNDSCEEETGNTPLHFIALALSTGSKTSKIIPEQVVECAQLLIDHGAREVKNKAGHTFRDIMNNYMETCSFLTGYNASYCKQIKRYYVLQSPSEPEPSSWCALI